MVDKCLSGKSPRTMHAVLAAIHSNTRIDVDDAHAPVADHVGRHVRVACKIPGDRGVGRHGGCVGRRADGHGVVWGGWGRCM